MENNNLTPSQKPNTKSVEEKHQDYYQAGKDDFVRLYPHLDIDFFREEQTEHAKVFRSGAEYAASQFKSVVVVEPDTKEEQAKDEFLLHLIDVVSCFCAEGGNYYSTEVRRGLIEDARKTFKKKV